jgi:hypothetical protein
MMRTLLFAVFLGFATFSAKGADESDKAKAKATDIAQMQQISQALQAFKKATGEFPDHLHQLVPEFLPEAKTLVSPLGPDKGPWVCDAWDAHDPKLPSSYAYVFGAAEYPGADTSGREVSTVELQELGPTVPILRCFMYGDRNVLNISHAGDVFESNFRWERDPRVTPFLQKNGMGPGPKEGRKWTITIKTPDGQPFPGLPLKIGGRSLVPPMPSTFLPERVVPTDRDGKVVLYFGPGYNLMASFSHGSDEWFVPSIGWNPEGIGGEKSDDITVVAQPAGRAGGVILDPQGKPAKGANVYFRELPDPARWNEGRWLTGAITDAQGRWQMPSAPRAGANLYLSVSYPGARTSMVRLAADSSPSFTSLFARTAEIRLATPAKISGTVSSAGQPVPNAIVWLTNWTGISEATTDAAGRFEISVNEKGEKEIGVAAPGFAPLRQTVKSSPDSAPLSFDLEKGRRVTARIVDKKNGQKDGSPNQKVFFTGFFPEPGLMKSQILIGVTDREGRFTWEHAPRMEVNYTTFSESGKHSGGKWNTAKDEEATLELYYGFQGFEHLLDDDE